MRKEEDLDVTRMHFYHLTCEGAFKFKSESKDVFSVVYFIYLSVFTAKEFM